MTCAAAGSHEQAVTGCASDVAHPVSPNRKGVPPPTSRGRAQPPSPWSRPCAARGAGRRGAAARGGAGPTGRVRLCRAAWRRWPGWHRTDRACSRWHRAAWRRWPGWHRSDPRVPAGPGRRGAAGRGGTGLDRGRCRSHPGRRGAAARGGTESHPRRAPLAPGGVAPLPWWRPPHRARSRSHRAARRRCPGWRPPHRARSRLPGGGAPLPGSGAGLTGRASSSPAPGAVPTLPGSPPDPACVLLPWPGTATAGSGRGPGVGGSSGEAAGAFEPVPDGLAARGVGDRWRRRAARCGGWRGDGLDRAGRRWSGVRGGPSIIGVGGRHGRCVAAPRPRRLRRDLEPSRVEVDGVSRRAHVGHRGHRLLAAASTASLAPTAGSGRPPRARSDRTPRAPTLTDWTVDAVIVVVAAMPQTGSCRRRRAAQVPPTWCGRCWFTRRS